MRLPLALQMSGVSKSYGSIRALANASLEVRPGTIHAILGENGAGKSSLMHIAYGTIRADAGRVRVGGRELTLSSPLDAIAAGVGMVHQHFTLVPSMTVAENISLGGRGRLHARAMVERVHDIARRTGFFLDPLVRVEELPVGAQQRVEIAKALARNASLLILDEPTAMLAPAEVDDLLRWLRAYASAGNAAIIITHKLREALAVADDITVLRRGHVVDSRPAHSWSATTLTAAMLGVSGGDEESNIKRQTSANGALSAGQVVLRVSALSVIDAAGRQRVRDASFAVHAGEILGLVALEGAGHRELLRVLARRLDPTSGSLEGPRVVGFVPEDRHQDAVLLDRSLTENLALRGGGVRRGFVDWSDARARAEALLRSFDVRALEPHVRMRTLSGGNQQKFVLARELSDGMEENAPEALVVENPTRGLDVRAAADLHHRLREARSRGAAIVFYSSDLDEVLAIADRVIAVHDGTLREVPLDRDVVGHAMLGVT